MEYSYPNWHARFPWSFTSADKEATNLLRHACMLVHFAALVAFFFCPPEARPPALFSQRLARLRSSSSADGRRPPLRARPIFTGTSFPVNEIATPGRSYQFVLPTETEHAQMRARMTPDLLDRYFRCVS